MEVEGEGRAFIFSQKESSYPQDQACPVVKTLVAKSLMNKPYVEFLMAYGLAAKFEFAHRQLTALIIRLYTGWIQSAICERANKVIKGCARDNPNAVDHPKNTSRIHTVKDYPS